MAHREVFIVMGVHRGAESDEVWVVAARSTAAAAEELRFAAEMWGRNQRDSEHRAWSAARKAYSEAHGGRMTDNVESFPEPELSALRAALAERSKSPFDENPLAYNANYTVKRYEVKP